MTDHNQRTRAVPAPRRSRAADPHTDLPAAGHLLVGVETVLSVLASPSEPADNSRLANELRGALARTAACGDTCRVRPAADAIRHAANLLLNGSVPEAQVVLAHVRVDPQARQRGRRVRSRSAAHEPDRRGGTNRMVPMIARDNQRDHRILR